VEHKQVKISDRKEGRFGDIVTPFSSSGNHNKIRSRLKYFLKMQYRALEKARQKIVSICGILRDRAWQMLV